MRTEKDTLVEQLREAVRGREREKALELLKKGALDGVTQEQRQEICKSLMTLRNMDIINYLAKQEEKFSSEMLRMDFEPYLNKNFVRQVLARHRKKFDLEDERECENLFEIACQANDPETVKYLIRQGRGKSRYALLGEAQMSVFPAVRFHSAGCPDTGCVDGIALFSGGLRGGDGEDAVRGGPEDGSLLCGQSGEKSGGFDGAADSGEPLWKRQKGEPSPHAGRPGAEAAPPSAPGEGTSDEKAPLSKGPGSAITVALVAAAVIIGYGVYFIPRWMESTGSGADTTQEDTTQGTDMRPRTRGRAQSTNGADQGTDGADPGADTSEDGGDNAYNTDTSLVVADGDTVNIDYTGYVDDVPFDGGSTDGAGTSLTIGSGRYIDDFEEQLIGHHVGETVTVNVTFPEDYSSEELQGKDARFEVTINGIYE